VTQVVGQSVVELTDTYILVYWDLRHLLCRCEACTEQGYCNE